MEKSVRLHTILELVGARNIARQDEIVSLLTELGYGVTQASVSRDLDELGIVKVDGFYTLPALDKRKAKLGVRSVEAAGDVLIVVKTEPGFASAAATQIDSAGMGEVVGTIAGDDTIFVAVRKPNQQRAVIKRLFEMFGG